MKWDDAMWRTRCGPLLFALVVGALSACGSEDPLVSGNDPAIEPFLGDWEATELVVVNDANASDSVDVLEEGGIFTINVQPSGTYTATLSFLGAPFVEIGQLSVFESTLILQPTQPPGPSATSTFEFDGPDNLTLDGPLDFDFNGDGTPEPGQGHIELVRQ